MGQILLGRSGAGAGGRLKYNLFVQPDEPATKDGLWIQAPQAERIQDVTLKDNYARSGKFNAYGVSDFVVTDKLGGTLSRYFDESNVYYYRSVDYRQDNGLKIHHILVYQYNVFTGGDTLVFESYEIPDEEPCYSAIIGPYVEYIEYQIVNKAPNKNVSNYLYDIRDKKKYSVSLSHTSDARIDPDRSAYDEKNNIIYGIVVYRYSSSSKNLSFDFDSINLQTKTTQLIDLKEFDLSKGQAIFVDNRVVFINSSNISSYNPATQTLQTIISNIPWTGGYYGLAYLNVLYIIIYHAVSSTSSNLSYIISVYQLNLDTNMLVLLDSIDLSKDTSSMNTTATRFITNKGIGILIDDRSNNFTYGEMKMCQLSFSKDSVPEKTLCLLKGNFYNFPLVDFTQVNNRTQKALQKMPKYSAELQQSEDYQYTPPQAMLSIDNAWYYDTDFQEYPTYIGDGTQWTKIKN